MGPETKTRSSLGGGDATHFSKTGISSTGEREVKKVEKGPGKNWLPQRSAKQGPLRSTVRGRREEKIKKRVRREKEQKKLCPPANSKGDDETEKENSPFPSRKEKYLSRGVKGEKIASRGGRDMKKRGLDSRKWGTPGKEKAHQRAETEKQLEKKIWGR